MFCDLIDTIYNICFVFLDEWDPVKWPPLQNLKSVPSNIPAKIVPSYETVDIGRLRGMVDKCVEVGILNDKEKGVWNSFLNKEEELSEYYQKQEHITYTGIYYYTIILFIDILV